MDQANPFESRTTYRLHRAEYLLLLAIVTALFVYHIRDVRWLPAVGLFVYIDLIGYIPGAIAWHRSQDKQISKVYYVLYNLMHSLITQTVVVGVWGLTIGWEWALLVVPFHLFGDRGLFGNFLKPFGLSFEPQPHPAYAAISAALDPRPGAAARPETASQPARAHSVAR
jgi:Ca2+/Na+ antiporter